ncbi:ACT domain-containing protein [Streptomyces sp. NPDC086838]|uniref:ACT domain-containing protein n=1 Tax=Streptomyces sp. NPDC086838 TaxID=3365762 RepID=UPI00380A7B49
MVREAGPRAGAAERWVGVYDADAGHGLDVPGLLASVVAPLAGAGVPVFVMSTCDADLVLVPELRKDDAAVALEAAGHEVVQPAVAWSAAPEKR